MNTTQLKNYAPAARKAFIAAVKAQAAKVGVTARETAAAKLEGDVLLVAGQAFPKAIAPARRKLTDRVRAHGFEPTMEAIAYTWFNRFAAIRYMELHGYLDHGYRVLSHPEGRGRPEILDHAADVDLPGLDRAEAVELKLEGTKDEELYRLLLKAQCNALHQAMPFLFDPIGSETELLLPANLLHSDSLIRQMVESIDEDLWQDIEIIGWLYQFYISEKKDEVIGKKVASGDIPAATQLFTPKWIVQHLVQGAVAGAWLSTYPNSPLARSLELFVAPAEQPPEVDAALASFMPSKLTPEQLTLLDPACGSGHILVEGYELLKAIYLERGYRQRDVPKLVLEHNIFGLDIDERAAQLAGFALMMKGRADDRRLFERQIALNVHPLVDSTGFDVEALTRGVSLDEYELTKGDVIALRDLFAQATVLGSLIRIPEATKRKLPNFYRLLELSSQDLFVSEALRRLQPLVRQADQLATQYDAVVANPPYMGRKYQCAEIQSFAQEHFESSRADLYGMFILRNIDFAKPGGRVGMITMDSWLAGEDFKDLRPTVLEETFLVSMAHLGPHAFPEIKGEVVQTACFSLLKAGIRHGRSRVFDLVAFSSSSAKEAALRSHENEHVTDTDTLRNFPRSVLTAYRATAGMLEALGDALELQSIAEAVTGLQTGDNPRFIRAWPEVAFPSIKFDAEDADEARQSDQKWFPYVKGSDYRKWFGNEFFVVNWLGDGAEIRDHRSSTVRNADRYFQPGLAYNNISKSFCARYTSPGFIFDQKNSMFFAATEADRLLTLGLLHSDAITPYLDILSPKDFGPGALKILPVPVGVRGVAASLERVERLVELHRLDWSLQETSWSFTDNPLIKLGKTRGCQIEEVYSRLAEEWKRTVVEAANLEMENNAGFIQAYGLQDDMRADVATAQVTLSVNPANRYGDKLSDDEQWLRLRQETLEELVSYAVGCMMGRYSLDAPGLIYAESGNRGFDPNRYRAFPADDDGIVPVTDTAWFDDDACRRFVEFISVAWDADHLEENLTFVANNLGPKRGESSRETIRRWLSDKFFKDHHLKRYKKRPIYWLFSSGKQKAFQCLVYLHRYNEGTLARMRSEYVIPLQGKMAARIEKLQGDIEVATSTAHSKRLEKELAKLKKQQVELLAFDEKLRHYADRRISLDLDDGVKVNYGKFGDLLAEVKAVHGKKPEVT
ncbi:MAG: BREX-1 system adenine-specific DNA-methyltransferase PglX [Myxococcales bacterium]|nr:BREX-1 system adenine-specific DNA-methyltransferase PglX [Myxococcales bacterium]